jgi:hypothetical protein
MWKQRLSRLFLSGPRNHNRRTLCIKWFEALSRGISPRTNDDYIHAIGRAPEHGPNSKHGGTIVALSESLGDEVPAAHGGLIIVATLARSLR